MAQKKKNDGNGLVAENRQARRNYEVVDTLEAGIALLGTEVKSLRLGRANISESYARDEQGEIVLVNATIPIYPPAARFNHEPLRMRKLLLKKKELVKLTQGITRDGMTIVPLKLYFNERGIAKLLLGLAKGRKNHDKRDVEKKRDWDKQKARLMRNKG
ncbi:SsrA-binding protein SmpB [Hirschia maritima]|uniref:SsrA-binding protein SmpB n=1 Tax=Hirschia maritima TaxID=1121961 RepID=UPI0003656CCF|nr:SsrA-binding protein SmpB [Hirschia maritima]